jgi:hypothetical protein
MSDKFHRALRQRFGDRVPFAPEFVEVPAAIEPVIIEFFEGLAVLDSALRVQRIWQDDARLRIAISGSGKGLDDLISDAEDAAAYTMGAGAWYGALRERHGDAVPAAEHLPIREGLQPIVDELFAELADYAHVVRIYGITERDEGLVVLDARVSDDITASDKQTVYRILEAMQERLND